MRTMLACTAILIVGLVILGLQQFLGANEAAEAPGVFPEWLVPVGYFLSLICALGLFVGWARYRRVT
ncbi:hypothetical protein [Palleronia sp.]|uniref:hypothetical protein n=1 Tax=Palleronia sp. TaxID=1940284 RepID=UPI0035C7EF3D